MKCAEKGHLGAWKKRYILKDMEQIAVNIDARVGVSEGYEADMVFTRIRLALQERYNLVSARSVKLIKFWSFGMGGVFYAMGGVLNALRSSGSIVYSGQRLLLPVLAVTYIAKTILGTKRPNIPGILVGALVLTSIQTAFTLLSLEFYYTLVAQGIVLLFAAGRLPCLNSRPFCR